MSEKAPFVIDLQGQLAYVGDRVYCWCPEVEESAPPQSGRWIPGVIASIEPALAWLRGQGRHQVAERMAAELGTTDAEVRPVVRLDPGCHPRYPDGHTFCPLPAFLVLASSLPPSVPLV